MNSPTKHFFNDSTRTPDFAAFLILRWLTHHFLSILAFNVCRENAHFSLPWKKGKPKQSRVFTRCWHPPATYSGDPPAGKAGCRSPTGQHPTHRGPPLTSPCSPQHSTDGHCLLAPASFYPTAGARATKPACVWSTHTQHRLACPHTHVHACRARAGLCTPICVTVHPQAEQSTRTMSADVPTSSHPPHCELTTCS